MINYETNSFGDVTYNGEVYRLTGQAELTNALLPMNNYNDASEGESYDFQMSAPGIDKNGTEVIVYWIFSDIKGSEVELDSYDYGYVDHIVIGF